MKKSFSEWFAEVDKRVGELVGLSVNDLPDCPFFDWYEAGVSSKSAASKAVRAAKEDF